MYETVIIGAGAAGIEATKRCLKYGLKTVLIDKDYNNFGGLCLNKGCIPTKLYLAHSSYYDCQELYAKKEEIINSLRDSTYHFLRSKGIDITFAKANIIDNQAIEINGRSLRTKNIVIASGSLPVSPIGVDNKKIIWAEDIFTLKELPHKFLIVGAGAVGLEIASFLNNWHKEVLVIEKLNCILPNFRSSLSSRLQRILEGRGIKIKLNEDINNYNLDEFDMIIIATGRKPNIEPIENSLSRINLNKKEGIEVDEYLETSLKGVYACGDVIGKKMLAYIAEEQARICIDNIMGKKRKEDYYAMPECVFTKPQLAIVGISQEEADQMNIKYRVIKSHFRRFSSSYVYSDENGFIQILCDDKDIIIGAEIISNLAAELISILALGIRCKLSLEELKETNFIHPTLSEIFPKLIKEI